LGLDRTTVRKAIEFDARKNLKNVIDNRAYDGIVTVDGYQLQYSIYRIRKDLYNIGRIHELK